MDKLFYEAPVFTVCEVILEHPIAASTGRTTGNVSDTVIDGGELSTDGDGEGTTGDIVW